ncbi:MAG: CHAD domain-containing protein [Steroidobacteraceae bacterium]
MPGKSKSLLNLPVRDAVRRVAGNYLNAASRGLARLEDPEDPKGLHAFRVAIRRLRSLLRAYRPWLGRIAGRKVRRRLRDLTRATNIARDAEVQIAWLSTQREQLARNELPGFNWLLRRLRDRKRRADRSGRAQLGRDFARIVQLMGNRLDDADESGTELFPHAFFDVLEPGIAELKARLAAISGADDEEDIHRSRIQIKRLRYLVEPLRKELAEARALVRQFKDLQNLLGELHDMHVLEDELAAAVEEAATEKARSLHRLAVGGKEKSLKREQGRGERFGLVGFAARARARRDALYAELKLTWLAKSGRGLAQELESLRGAVSTATDAAAAASGRRRKSVPPNLAELSAR